jgi:hypothetical protein
MNVFVLCTGRCGSQTFVKACSHFSNYSSAHESRMALLGPERLRYPGNHIEADNRLSWLLGRLDEVYGDTAFYVHLKRDVAAVAASYVRRFNFGIMQAYRDPGIIMGLPKDTDPIAVAVDYCNTVDSNIELFLKGKSRQMTFWLESAQRDFPVFCDRIGAEGDLTGALSEFSVRHDDTVPRRRFSLWRAQSRISALVPLVAGLQEEIARLQDLC